MKKHYKSPFPANNVHRRDEPVATDNVYYNTPAIDHESKIAQFTMPCSRKDCFSERLAAALQFFQFPPTTFWCKIGQWT